MTKGLIIPVGCPGNKQRPPTWERFQAVEFAEPARRTVIRTKKFQPFASANLTIDDNLIGAPSYLFHHISESLP